MNLRTEFDGTKTKTRACVTDDLVMASKMIIIEIMIRIPFIMLTIILKGNFRVKTNWFLLSGISSINLLVFVTIFGEPHFEMEILCPIHKEN